MAFSETTKDLALKRANNRCECTRKHSGHPYGRCPNTRNLEFHHITAISSGGSDNLSNCEVLCHDCHVLTQTYGG